MKDTSEMEYFGEVISSYTRAQAIEDGELVDMMAGEFGKATEEAGFRYPIAMTNTAFSLYVALTEKAKEACNDEQGRWWDILTMLKFAMRLPQNVGKSEIIFEFRCVVNRLRPRRCLLKAVVGPGDSGEPVITVLLPDED